jgi:hypothetical protein
MRRLGCGVSFCVVNYLLCDGFGGLAHLLVETFLRLTGVTQEFQ